MRILAWLGVIALVLAACGSGTEANQSDCNKSIEKITSCNIEVDSATEAGACTGLSLCIAQCVETTTCPVLRGDDKTSSDASNYYECVLTCQGAPPGLGGGGGEGGAGVGGSGGVGGTSGTGVGGVGGSGSVTSSSASSSISSSHASSSSVASSSSASAGGSGGAGGTGGSGGSGGAGGKPH